MQCILARGCFSSTLIWRIRLGLFIKASRIVDSLPRVRKIQRNQPQIKRQQVIVMAAIRFISRKLINTACSLRSMPNRMAPLLQHRFVGSAVQQFCMTNSSCTEILSCN